VNSGNQPAGKLLAIRGIENGIKDQRLFQAHRLRVRFDGRQEVHQLSHSPTCGRQHSEG